MMAREMVVPRKRFLRRIRRDEAPGGGEGLVDAWRMWVGWKNELLTLGHKGWCRWGRRAGCGDG